MPHAWQFSLKSLLAITLAAASAAFALAPLMRTAPAQVLLGLVPWCGALAGSLVGLAVGTRLAKLNSTPRKRSETLVLAVLGLLLVARLWSLLESYTRVALSWPSPLSASGPTALEISMVFGAALMASWLTVTLIAAAFPTPPVSVLLVAVMACAVVALVWLTPAQPWLARRLAATAATWLGGVAGACCAIALDVQVRQRMNRLGGALLQGGNTSWARWLSGACAMLLFAWLALRRPPYTVAPVFFAGELLAGFLWGLLTAQCFTSQSLPQVLGFVPCQQGFFLRGRFQPHRDAPARTLEIVSK